MICVARPTRVFIMVFLGIHLSVSHPHPCIPDAVYVPDLLYFGQWPSLIGDALQAKKICLHFLELSLSLICVLFL